MDFSDPYYLVIGASLILILSFIFGEISRKTNIPSVLMLIILGIGLGYGLNAVSGENIDYFTILFPVLEILGIVGLIMIVLEAALELELKREKYVPIAKAMLIAFVGLMLSTWIAAEVLYYFIEGMSKDAAWIYATPLSILSSAIIIPSVVGLKESKKEFHIYESTFSDIMGIMLFYFLTGNSDAAEHSSGLTVFAGNVVLTIVLSLIASYLIVLIFQNIKGHTKLFLLIAVLLLLYAIGKKFHLSSLIIILVFGLLIANMKLFFKPKFLKNLLNYKEAHHIYEGLHVITMETAFVVRTFFFVIFGLTIKLATLANLRVAGISILIIASIYALRWLYLRIFIGKDINPQLYIAPRGLITVLLFYAIPTELEVPGFEPGILLYIIIITSLIMTWAMINDKRRAGESVKKALEKPVGFEKWKAPSIEEK